MVAKLSQRFRANPLFGTKGGVRCSPDLVLELTNEFSTLRIYQLQDAKFRVGNRHVFSIVGGVGKAWVVPHQLSLLCPSLVQTQNNRATSTARNAKYLCGTNDANVPLKRHSVKPSFCRYPQNCWCRWQCDSHRKECGLRLGLPDRWSIGKHQLVPNIPLHWRLFGLPPWCKRCNRRTLRRRQLCHVGIENACRECPGKRMAPD